MTLYTYLVTYSYNGLTYAAEVNAVSVDEAIAQVKGTRQIKVMGVQCKGKANVRA